MIKIKTLLCLGLIAPAYCLAAVFSVNTTTDLVDLNPGDGICEATGGGGDCALRAAIMETNSLAGADEINLPAGVYLLTIAGDDSAATVGDLDVVNSELTISGAGMESTFIDGNSIDRVFYVNLSNLVIRDLSIRNGLGKTISYTGGGIHLTGNTSELLLQRVHLTNNAANAGGGLYASGESVVSLENCLLTENTTVDLGVTNQNGPAIWCNHCSIKIDSSSITHNHLLREAIMIEGGDLEMLNSTVSENDHGGVYTQNSTGIIKFSTFINNGEENFSHYSFDDTHIVQIGNSVLQSDTSNDCDQGDLPVSIGYNITSDDSCSFVVTGDMQNTDARMGPLMENGGVTPTHVPGNDSASLDKIPLAACTDIQGVTLSKDQRGFDRPFAEECDLGAVEKVTDLVFKDGFE